MRSRVPVIISLLSLLSLLAAVTLGLVPAAGPAAAQSPPEAAYQLAFVRDGRVVVVDRPGGEERIVDVGLETATMVRFSPDGMRLGTLERYQYRSKNGDVVVTDLTGGCRRAVLHDNVGATGLAWAGNGAELAFTNLYVSEEDGLGQGVFSVPSAALEAPVRRLVSGARHADDAPAWHPDGRWVAFTTVRDDGTTDITRRDIRSGEVVALAAAAASERNPAWSPRGDRLAYIRGTDLVVAGFDGTGARVVGTALAEQREPAWTPDGRRLLVSAIRGGEGGVFEVDPATGGHRRLTTGADGSPTAAPLPAPAGTGYELVDDRLGAFAFGSACPRVPPAGGGRPFVAAAAPPAGPGVVGVTASGVTVSSTRTPGWTPPRPLAAPAVGVTTTPSGDGTWVVAGDGGVFATGAARFLGSMGGRHLNRPVVGMAATPTGRGYWLVATDGGIFAFGDARFFGSTGAIRLNQPIVGMAATPSGRGYWLVATDGGIFAFGDARFLGSMGDVALDSPIVAMAPSDTGRGYRLVARDGGVFTFGDAPFLGSSPQTSLQPIIGLLPA